MRSPFNYRFGLPSPFYDNETGFFSPASLFALSEPGVWFDPSDVANLNWRYNLLTWTEDFSNPIWLKPAGTSTVTPNTATAPDGTMTADLVTATAGIACHYVAQNTTATGAVTCTVYAKAGTANWLGLGSGYTNGVETAWFDLATGTRGTVASGGTSTMDPVVGYPGWWRCSHTRSSWTGGAALPFVTNGNGVPTFNAVGTENLLLWGAQLELGSVATTYQPITDVNTEVVQRFPYATLYQDTAGTIPVTGPTTLSGASSTVALMLDKSKGLVPGPELITNAADRDFSSDTGFWTKNAPEISIGGGVCAFTSAADSRGIERNFFVTPGKYYEITFTVVSRTSGGFQAYVGNPVGATYTAPGTYTQRLMCSGNNYLGIVARGTTTGSIDNISVKEIPGNHATQITPAARPNYAIEPAGGRRNIFTQTENFGDTVVWNTSGLTYSSAAGFDGTTKNALVTVASTSNRLRTNGNTVLPNTQYTFSFYAKLGTATGNRYAVFDVTNATLFVANVIYDSQLNSSTYTRVSVTFTTPAGCTQIYPYLMNGNTTTGTVFLDGAQLELGSPATNYQKVTTQYDVTEAGKASMSYLYFDGVNDAMVTSTITPGIDKAQVFAGVRKLSNASRGILVEFSSVYSNPGSFGIDAPNNALNNYAFVSTGTFDQAAIASPFSAPITNVLTGLGDISGDTSTIRINGAQAAQNTGNQGTGNYLAYPLYIGARGGSSLPFTGHLYSLITRFGPTLDAPTIASTETWVAGKTGFYTPIITGVPTIGVS